MSQQIRDRKPLHALTGIRALAAVWVVVFHLRRILIGYIPGSRQFDGFISLGYLGVDLFFALSGFVLTYNYIDKLQGLGAKGYFRFLGLRLARIYPVHLVLTGAMVAGTLVAPLVGANFGRPSKNFQLDDLFRHLTLTHAWGGSAEQGWNFPSWSISAEWAAYLVFPLLGLLLHRSRWKTGLLVLSALIYAAMLYLAQRLYGSTLDLTMEGGLVRVAGGFTVGCVLCTWYLAAPEPSKRWDNAAIVCFVTIFGVCLGLTKPFWIVYLFGFLILALAKAHGWFSAWLGSGIMIYLGKISYAFYMVHALIFLRIKPTVFEPLGLVSRIGLLFGMIVGAGVAAHLLYNFVEEPARKRIRRWIESS